MQCNQYFNYGIQEICTQMRKFCTYSFIAIFDDDNNYSDCTIKFTLMQKKTIQQIEVIQWYWFNDVIWH